ncbi:hypothetical protein [Streptomyces enissocaesilis]
MNTEIRALVESAARAGVAVDAARYEELLAEYAEAVRRGVAEAA